MIYKFKTHETSQLEYGVVITNDSDFGITTMFEFIKKLQPQFPELNSITIDDIKWITRVKNNVNHITRQWERHNKTYSLVEWDSPYSSRSIRSEEKGFLLSVEQER